MKLHSFDLNLLLAFDALAEEQSVTRAAARLGLSQPAMSGALARRAGAEPRPYLPAARHRPGAAHLAAAQKSLGGRAGIL